jgi:hypothetical protein
VGDPSPAYRDRDGSRNDPGVYGGPGSPAYVLSLAFAPAFSLEGSFTVSWQGRAADGVQDYDIQYRRPTDVAWQDWLSSVTGLSAVFGPSNPVPVSPGQVFCFRSRARDLAGHLEIYPVGPQACIFVVDKIIYLPIIMRR